MKDSSLTLHPMRRLISNRRGLLAGVAALAAAGLARFSDADRAEATHFPNTGTPNADNNAIHNTTFNGINFDVSVVRWGGLTSDSGRLTTFAMGAMAALGSVLSGSNQGRFGVLGAIGPASLVQLPIPEQSIAGVWGVSAVSDTVNASGVKGLATAGVTNGVWGQNDSSAQNATGVFGQTTSTTGQTVGVWGRSESTHANAIGVYGHVNASGAAGIGVRGDSVNGIGVYGESTNSYGCGGATSKPGFAGLFGYAGVASAAGFLGVNGAPGGTAGYFHGAVTVDGPFQVVNGPKNALVAHPDGSHRRMYCQESPEPWFEDFGRSQLQNGRATVRLDPDFAAVSRSDDYEVFVTPKGACEGLYMANQTPASFEVHELRGGTSSVPFSYRVVARRKDDVGGRMEKVDLPRFDLRPPGPPQTPPGQDKQPTR